MQVAMEQEKCELGVLDWKLPRMMTKSAVGKAKPTKLCHIIKSVVDKSGRRELDVMKIARSKSLYTWSYILLEVHLISLLPHVLL